MYKRFGLDLAMLLGAVLLATTVTAQIPNNISYQGRVTIPGNPSTASFKVRIYDAPTGGAKLWEEVHANIVLTNDAGGSLFNLILGTETQLNAAGMLFDKPYWLEVEINGSPPLAPRTELLTAPYAFRARFVDSVLDGSITREKLADNSVTVRKISTAGGSNNSVMTIDANGEVGWGYAAIKDASVSLAKINPVGALSGQVLTCAGQNVIWSTPTLALPYAGTTSGNSPAFQITTTGNSNAFVADFSNTSFSGNGTVNAGNIALFQKRGVNKARIDNAGKGFFNGGTQASGADLAEAFAVDGVVTAYEPGDVLVISTSGPRRVEKCSEPYSTLVAGVYATRSGMLLTEEGIDSEMKDLVPMGVVGVIPTKVTTENGAIRIGNLLVTSSTLGHAMKADPAIVGIGQVLGKALEAFTGDTSGKINVLVGVR